MASPPSSSLVDCVVPSQVSISQSAAVYLNNEWLGGRSPEEFLSTANRLRTDLERGETLSNPSFMLNNVFDIVTDCTSLFPLVISVDTLEKSRKARHAFHSFCSESTPCEWSL